MPLVLCNKFELFIQGDEEANEWFFKYNEETEYKFGTIIYEISGDSYSEENCYYNIGMLYYSGNKEIPLEQSKEKAFYWFNNQKAKVVLMVP